MNKTKEPRNRNVYGKISEKIFSELERIGKETGLGNCQLVSLGVIHIIYEFKQIEDCYKEINKSLKDFKDIFNKRFANFAHFNIKNSLNNLTNEDRIMMELNLFSPTRE